jgi:hypothetical protein
MFELAIFALSFDCFLASGLIMFHWMYFGLRQPCLTQTLVMSLGFSISMLHLGPWFRGRLK